MAPPGFCSGAKTLVKIGSTAHIPPPVNPIPILEPDVPKTLPKPNIPYPSRRNDQKSRDKASNQMEKIFQIFQDLRFDISFADALLLMPRFAPTIKSLLMNKEKLLELAKIPLNENCSAMLLKKLPEKLEMPSNGSTTPFSDSRPSLTSFETSDSLLEDFADKLALFDPFPLGNEDVDIEAELKEIKFVMLPDSQKINFLTFSNPLFDYSAPSNDESSHEEVTHEMSCITYSNPLFDLDKEIISSKFNLIHNKVLDSISKNDHFDAKSYLPESPLNHDTLTVFSPRNDPLHHEFAGEIITNPSIIAREHEEYISLKEV
ncbi:hypothetical protein Tco_0415587 [Tanacetum coccineum]